MAKPRLIAMFLPLALAALSACSYGSKLCSVDTDCVNGDICIAKTCISNSSSLPDDAATPDGANDSGTTSNSAYYCHPCMDDSDCGGTDNTSGISSNGNYCQSGTCSTGCQNQSDCPSGATCAAVTTPSGAHVGSATACRPSRGACPGEDGGHSEDAGPMDSGQPGSGVNDAGLDDSGPADAGPPDAGPPDAGPPDAGPPDAGPMGCVQNNALCSGSTPVCDPATDACSACIPSQVLSPCPRGQYCFPMGTEYSCAAGCNTVSDCNAVTNGVVACCNNACVNTASNEYNCGGCGMACSSGEVCCGSSCAAACP